jgi:hypothetical protein
VRLSHWVKIGKQTAAWKNHKTERNKIFLYFLYILYPFSLAVYFFSQQYVFDDSVTYHLSYDSAQNENPAFYFFSPFFISSDIEMFKPQRVSMFTIKGLRVLCAENPRETWRWRTIYTNEWETIENDCLIWELSWALFTAFQFAFDYSSNTEKSVQTWKRKNALNPHCRR